jgi:hypothetical protein
MLGSISIPSYSYDCSYGVAPASQLPAIGAFSVKFYASSTPPQVLLCLSKATIDQHEAYGGRAMQSVCQDSFCQLCAWWSHAGCRESAN